MSEFKTPVFTNHAIRKTAIDLSDIAREIQCRFPDDPVMDDVRQRCSKVAVLLMGYFPPPVVHLQDLKEHTSDGC
jgi:hypothetical protein